MSSLPKLSLVIPCYNEESTLAPCVEKCLELRASVDLELVIVDDCSKDKSLEVARALAQKYPQVRVLHHEVNQGKGAALRTGFTHAHGDFVGIQDADLEYNPLQYAELLQPLLEGRADAVFGSRYLRPSSHRALYFWHSLMNRALTFASNMCTNLDITDMETCYKLFGRDLIAKIAPTLQENRFGFEPEVTAKIAQSGARLYECAIDYSPRSYEEGKKIGWKDGVRALYCILHYSANTAPLPMQLLIYLFIGAVSLCMNVASFCALHSLSLPWTAQIVGAYFASTLLNYLLCIAILFRHKARWKGFDEFIVYLVVVLAMGLVDYALMDAIHAAGIGSVISKTLAAGVGFVLNFALRRWIVFPEKRA